MHRNTFITIASLAVIAALLLGINIGRKLNFSLSTPTPTPVPTPTTTPSPRPAPRLEATGSAQGVASNSAVPANLFTYRNASCRYSVGIPTNWQYEENDATTTMLTNGTEEILISCAADIPEFDQSSGQKITINGKVGTKLQETDPETGQLVTVIVFMHNGKPLIISGSEPALTPTLSQFRFE